MPADPELPPGYRYEYMDGDDGGASVSTTKSEFWPSTRYRRIVQLSQNFERLLEFVAR